MARQSERGGYIPGVPCWVDVTVPDPAAVLPFYRGLFGWELDNVAPQGAPPYFIARLPGGDVAGVTALPAGSAHGARWDTYISVADVDESVTTARDAGGTVVTEPFEIPGTGWMAVLADPEGALICIWQTGEGQGAEVVNEHGALNFNTLATRDPDGAAAFYGALFGWQKLALPTGLAWALPSYGEHLERASPGLGEQMDQMGAPEGFINVVAALQPIADDDADTRAHWSVVFGIDDTDAAVATAVELGGTIVAEPFTAPWTRMAVLADPQGAPFLVSQFIPNGKDTDTP